MKKILLLGLIAFCFPIAAQAQSNSSTTVSLPNTEAKLQELITEVRQLRAELQRMNANAYRGQLLLERHKTQQELVTRLTSQLNDVREQIAQLRLEKPRLEAINEESVEKQVAAGMKSKDELTMIRQIKESAKQREQDLLERESQLSSELNTERSTLADLKTRLDALEQEMSAPSEPAKKRD